MPAASWQLSLGMLPETRQKADGSPRNAGSKLAALGKPAETPQKPVRKLAVFLGMPAKSRRKA